MAEKKTQDYLDRLKQLEQIRDRRLKALTLDVSEYIAPARGRFSSTEMDPDTAHGLRGSKILDPTARKGLRVATNGMHSGLTPQSRRWFRLAFLDPDMNKHRPFAEWMQKYVEQTAYNVLRRTNWYSAIRSIYAEVLAFSTGCMYQQEDPRYLTWYRPYTWGEYLVGQDSYGRPDTLYRTFMMPVRQLERQFGTDKLSTTARDLLKTTPDKSIEVVHAVQPRKNRDANDPDRFNMAWESVYFERSERDFLQVGGYREFPFMVPRFSVIANDCYGNEGPGFEVVDDVKQVQDMQKSILLAQHKQLDPPVRAPRALQGVPLRTGAGGITYYDSDNPEGLKPLYEVRFDVGQAKDEADRVRRNILDGFYYSLFLMLLEDQRSNVTATEIIKREAESLQQLGSLIESLQDALLDPAVSFLVSRIIEKGLVPPPPRELQGADYRIEYISVLAQAQRMIGAKTIDENMGVIGQAAAIWPEARHVVDISEALRERLEITGFPARAIRGDEDIAKLMEMDRQQQMQAQMMQAAATAADATQKLGRSPVNPEDPNALTALLGMEPEGGVQ